MTGVFSEATEMEAGQDGYQIYPPPLVSHIYRYYERNQPQVLSLLVLFSLAEADFSAHRGSLKCLPYS